MDSRSVEGAGDKEGARKEGVRPRRQPYSRAWSETLINLHWAVLFCQRPGFYPAGQSEESLLCHYEQQPEVTVTAAVRTKYGTPLTRNHPILCQLPAPRARPQRNLHGDNRPDMC